MIKQIVFLIVLTTGFIIAQNKSSFDIKDAGLKKSSDAGNGLIVVNDKIEAAMLPGGYFTIGTNKGISELSLDNDCQVMYGHPYALTSHPIISIDDTWYNTDELFNKELETSISKSGDTLTLLCNNEQLDYKFSIIINESTGKITFVQIIKNLDSKAHKLSTGILLDPALGKWGDGSLFIDNTIITNDTTLTFSETSPNISVWEKQSGARGMGFNISSDQVFSLSASNWKPSPQTSSGFEVNKVKRLYDLLLAFHFENIQIESGEEKRDVLLLTMNEPDFSNDIFTRWDLPNYLDLSDGLMFPREFETFAELTDLTKSAISCTIEPVLSSNLISKVQQYTTSLNLNSTFQKIPLSSSISYEDKVVEAVLKIRMNNVLVDEIHRNVFIPETPVSDTGLTVDIDTVKTSSLPKVEFIFNVKNNRTGSSVAGLNKENIFLHENSSRIYDFIIAQDTTNGINSADIVFALDVTGSMSSTIDKVKNNIVEFADSLNARGIDYRLGLVTFLDEIENTYDFTNDVNVFKNWVSQQYAHGGGDGPENSLQALKTSAEFKFRTNCKRMIVWITDIDYHENDWATPLSKKEIIDELLLNDITVHAIGNEGYKAGSYDPIIIPTNGKYYNIYGNFRDILMDISRMRASGKLVISYNSVSANTSNTVRLEIKYGGLGGHAEFQYTSNTQNDILKPHLSFFPNPFNPEITFVVNSSNFTEGNISIFNILGERVRTYRINDTGISRLSWNAKNDSGSPVSTGFYIVQLLLLKANKEIHKETAKILYMR